MRELVYKDRLQDDAVEAKIEELYRAFSAMNLANLKHGG